MVVHLAELLGWRVYAPPANRPVRSRTGRTYVQQVRAGYPDLTLVKPPRLLFLELKRETGYLEPEQVTWLRDLAAADAEVDVLRPRDWAHVGRMLTGASRGRGLDAPDLARRLR